MCAARAGIDTELAGEVIMGQVLAVAYGDSDIVIAGRLESR